MVSGTYISHIYHKIFIQYYLQHFYQANLLNISNFLSHLTVQKLKFQRVIVSICCGTAQTEMHSSSRDLNICLDVDKRALYVAVFSLKYLHKSKPNTIIQYHDMEHGLYNLLHSIQANTKLPILVLFQHPSPTTEIRHRQVLIKAAFECIKCLTILDWVRSIHFVYDWSEKDGKTSWKKNELRYLLIKECYLSSQALHDAITFTEDKNISYINTSMINHPVYGISKRRGWAQMKSGQERAFSVILSPEQTRNNSYTQF